MMRRPFCLILFSLVAACRQAPDVPAANEVRQAQGGSGEAVEAGPEPDMNATMALDQLADTNNHLPPPDAELRFLGRWAADERLCARSAWEFTSEGLRTPAGSVCRFRRVRAVPGGYDIDASCAAEGPEEQDVLNIRFAESARAMLFDSRTVAGTGLVHCPAQSDIAP